MTLTSVNILITLTNVLKRCIVIIMLVVKIDRYFMISIKVIFNTKRCFCTTQFDWDVIMFTSFFVGLQCTCPLICFDFGGIHIKRFSNVFSKRLSSWEFWFISLAVRYKIFRCIWFLLINEKEGSSWSLIFNLFTDWKRKNKLMHILFCLKCFWALNFVSFRPTYRTFTKKNAL